MLPDLKLVVREPMKETTKSLQDDIKKLHEDVKSSEIENENLKKTNNDLVIRLAEVEYETDNLEQYSKDENTDQQVIRIAGHWTLDQTTLIVHTGLGNSNRILLAREEDHPELNATTGTF